MNRSPSTHVLVHIEGYNDRNTAQVCASPHLMVGDRIHVPADGGLFAGQSFDIVDNLPPYEGYRRFIARPCPAKVATQGDAR